MVWIKPKELSIPGIAIDGQLSTTHTLIVQLYLTLHKVQNVTFRPKNKLVYDQFIHQIGAKTSTHVKKLKDMD